MQQYRTQVSVATFRQPSAQVHRRDLGRSTSHRIFCAGTQRLDHARAPAGLGAQQVRHDRVHTRPLVLQQARSAQVRRRPPRARQVLINRRAHDRMDKLQRKPGTQHAHRNQRVGSVERLALTEVGEARSPVELRVAPEHGHRPHQRRGRCGQARQRQQDGMGHRRWPQIGNLSRTFSGRADAIGRECRHELSDKKGRPARDAVTRRYERLVWPLAQPLLDQPGHTPLTQCRRAHHNRPRLYRKLRE